jgi:hypothetical protein
MIPVSLQNEYSLLFALPNKRRSHHLTVPWFTPPAVPILLTFLIFRSGIVIVTLYMAPGLCNDSSQQLELLRK